MYNSCGCVEQNGRIRLLWWGQLIHREILDEFVRPSRKFVELILFFFSLFEQIIILSDVESDYLNAQQCCSKLNIWVKPKLASHGFLVVLFLLTGHYWLCLFNLPMLGWSCYELYTLPPGNMGIYDPTEIHNRGMVRKHLRDGILYCAFFLIFFFIYLYWYDSIDFQLYIFLASDKHCFNFLFLK